MMNLKSPLKVASEENMAQFGAKLAAQLTPGDVVYLSGDLGVGKTTLARAIIRALGFEGRVKSPSYGLIEAYPATAVSVVHLDLYRLGDPAEVLDLGIEAYGEGEAVFLIEWPERGEGYIPVADWVIHIRDWPDVSVGADSTQSPRELTVSRLGADPAPP